MHRLLALLLLLFGCTTLPAQRANSYGFGEEHALRSRSARSDVWFTLLGKERSGTPLVLLHPWGTNLSIWRSLAQEVSKTRPVLLIDLPGHGRSGHPPGRYPPRRMAAAVHDVMRAVGFRRAIVGGNSLGGATSLAVALEYPESVAALILIGAPGGETIDEPTSRAVSAFTSPLHLRSLSPGTMRVSFWLVEGGTSEEGQVVLQEMLAQRGDAEWSLASNAQSSALYEVAHWKPEIEKIAARALVIHGSADRIVPLSSGRKLSERLQNAELIELDGCGHMPQLDCAKETSQAIGRFLSGF